MTDIAASHPEVEQAAKPRSGLWKIILLVIVVVALVAVVSYPPTRKWITALLESLVGWAEGLGFWGPVLLVAFYIVACVLLLPGSVLTIAAGTAFGLVTGTIAVSVGSTLGACAAFVVGRFVARGWAARKISANPKFAAIDEAVGRQGFRIVLLTRLTPVFPFNFQNYAYGLTTVPLWKYALASWIGMFPGTLLFVYIGSLVNAAAGEADVGRWILRIVGLVATIVVTVVITRIARKALKQAVAEQQAD